jgi:hypothetical protein
MTVLGTVPAGAFSRCAWCCGSLPTPFDRNILPGGGRPAVGAG